MTGHLVLFTTMLYVLFSERLFIRFSTGGRGILPILDLCMLALATALIVFSGWSKAGAFLRNREFWKYWFPYLLMSFLLPVVAVFFNDYPARTAMEGLQGIEALAFVVVGSWIGAAGPRLWKIAKNYILTAICVVFLFAAIQFGYGQGWSGGIFDALQQWDISSQLAYSERYVLTARSIGTYLNPNTLGFCGAMAIWSSLILLRGIPRVLGAGMSAATLLASQSRGSTMALIGSAVIWSCYIFCSSDRSLRKIRDISLALILISLVGATWAVMIFQDRLEQVSAQNRFERGLRFLSEGADADRNAAGRITGWIHALQFHQDHLLGTMGEPRYMFRDIIDNDYVKTILQGSVVYLMTFLMTIYGAFRLLARRGPTGWLLAMFSVVIAINGMTAHPLSYSVIAAFWIGIGFYLCRTVLSPEAQMEGFQAEPAPARVFRSLEVA